jgi:sirohydrochlorin ferrochelatase
MSDAAEKMAVILVDHGSLRAESNDMLLEVVEAYRRHSGLPIVEPAHMELAEPSIAAAFTRCVDQGATLVVVVPYFLAPGKHWHEDIPWLSAEAARPHAGVAHIVAPPLGLHPRILDVVDLRIDEALGRQHGPRG